MLTTLFLLSACGPATYADSMEVDWFVEVVPCIDQSALWTVPDPAPFAAHYSFQSSLEDDDRRMWNYVGATVNGSGGTTVDLGCSDDITITYGVASLPE